MTDKFLPEVYITVGLVITFLMLVQAYWSHTRERTRRLYFSNSAIIITNLRRLLKTDYIPISLEKTKIVKQYIEEITILETKLTYPDCPRLEIRDKERIKTLLVGCVDIYYNCGVPLDRIIKDTSIRYGS